MVRLTDTHCHLDFEAFSSDREQVISHALQAGIDRILNPGINLATSREAIRLSEEFTEVFAAVGIHPNDGSDWNDQANKDILRMANHPKVLAIGEIGLDYYRDHTAKELQRKIFISQLETAATLALPVIIHSRLAMPDTLDILEEWQSSLELHQGHLANNPGVLHSFEGDRGEAERAIQANFYIGVGGPVTFQNAKQRKELVSGLPLDHIVLETDAPFLAPQPYRGRRNEPAYIRLIAETIAELHDLPLSTVAEMTSNNAARLFSWN